MVGVSSYYPKEAIVMIRKAIKYIIKRSPLILRRTHSRSLNQTCDQYEDIIRMLETDNDKLRSDILAYMPMITNDSPKVTVVERPEFFAPDGRTIRLESYVIQIGFSAINFNAAMIDRIASQANCRILYDLHKIKEKEYQQIKESGNNQGGGKSKKE